jgi:hypothetical protein
VDRSAGIHGKRGPGSIEDDKQGDTSFQSVAPFEVPGGIAGTPLGGPSLRNPDWGTTFWGPPFGDSS